LPLAPYFYSEIVALERAPFIRIEYACFPLSQRIQPCQLFRPVPCPH
jgi:hypothetical protein